MVPNSYDRGSFNELRAFSGFESDLIHPLLSLLAQLPSCPASASGKFIEPVASKPCNGMLL